MSDEYEDQEVDQQLEKEARNMGWVPEAEFKGDKAGWIDAEAFVEKGRHVLPILLQNNKRLQRELLTRDQKLDTLKAQLEGATSAIEKLEHHYTEANKRAVETAKAQLKVQLKQAREDDDVDAEFEIQEKLADLHKAKSEEKPAPKKEAPPQVEPYSQEFVEWKAENAWFGPDKKKTTAIVRIAEDLREDGSDLKGREFFEECVRVYDLQNTPNNDERRPSKVEGGSSRAGHSNGKTFADLPKDAKQACWDDVDDLVGPNKRYKNQKEWESRYASIYFGAES